MTRRSGSSRESAVVHDNIMGFNKQYETILGEEESHFLEVKTTCFYCKSHHKKPSYFTFLTIVYQQ
jgi:hypothetical protein